MADSLTYLILLGVGFLLPILLTVVRFIEQRAVPMLAKRVDMGMPVGGLVGALIVTQALAIVLVLWIKHNYLRFRSLPATLTFLIYSGIPSISAYLAMKSVVLGCTDAYFFSLLGLYNFGGAFKRWVDDIADDARLDERKYVLLGMTNEGIEHFKQHILTGRRTLGIVLVADFVLEEILGHVLGLHNMVLFGPSQHQTRAKDATLLEFRSLSFAIGLIGAYCQTPFLDLLRSRTVLLRLLGARQTISAGLNLLLMGAFAVVSHEDSLNFLRERSPTPHWCCTILWIRKHGVVVGAVMPFIWYVLFSPTYWSGASAGVLVPASMLVGWGIGAFMACSYNNIWLEKQDHLESDYRILHLFPRVSSMAKEKLSAAMKTAIKKGGQASRDVAVEFFSARALRAAFSFISRR